MSFDPAAATAAYIDSLGPEALAKAEAYTVGGHWLLLWGVLVSALVTWLIVRSGLPDRLQTRLRHRPVRAAWLVSGLVLLMSGLLTLPWSIYTDYVRPRGYGRTSQPFADWLGQAGLSMLIGLVLGSLFFLGLYTLIRKTGRRWWLWSGGMVAVVIALMLLAGPVLIEPLFNDYKPLPAGEVRTALEAQAAEAGIPADRIFVYDGSRQSNNFTANVSGVLGSARIAISDVAFHGASLDEVKAVTGHEIGHYVKGHVWRSVALMTGLAMLLFFLADRLFPRLAALFGSKAAIGDPAGLPVLLFFASLAGLFAQPVISSFSRWSEAEADRYSLETVNLPDALSSALVKTAEYRYPRPGRLEEILFYDHPSVERRVRAAMEWKAAHPPAGDERGS